jgi:predicted Rossmann fold flavoprotein
VSVEAVDVAVVGAGAAGLAAAIFTARRRPDLRIVALDGAKKIGAKILVSGGGRCNVTNQVVTPDHYFGGSRNVIRRVLDAFPVADTVAFFREIGVELHAEENGKLFPDSNSARTVLAALLDEANRRGVRIMPGMRVESIERHDVGFDVVTQAPAIRARAIVLATGGRSLPKTGSDGGGYALAAALGHSLVPQTPALAPLLLAPAGTPGSIPFAELSGIAHEVEIFAHIAGTKPSSLRGSLLWTHFGVSGPAAMDISRVWHRATLDGAPVELRANFLPGEHSESAEKWLLDFAQRQPRTQLATAVATRLPARVADALLASLEIDRACPLAHLSRDVRRRVLSALLAWPLPVSASRGYAYAEATAGGVPLEEIDPATMASRKCPNMYLVGEILDVDGRIGGYNFQWAWSSGFVAAAGLAESREENR